jgi:hypothetical protein
MNADERKWPFICVYPRFRFSHPVVPAVPSRFNPLPQLTSDVAADRNGDSRLNAAVARLFRARLPFHTPINVRSQGIIAWAPLNVSVIFVNAVRVRKS